MDVVIYAALINVRPKEFVNVPLIAFPLRYVLQETANVLMEWKPVGRPVVMKDNVTKPQEHALQHHNQGGKNETLFNPIFCYKPIYSPESNSNGMQP